MIRFVYLDVAGTLLHPYPSVGAVYARACLPHGETAVTPERMETAFRAIWTDHLAGTGDQLLLAGDDDRATRRWWHAIVHEVLQQVDFQGDREAAFRACYEAFGSPAAWRLYPDVMSTLSGLRQIGIPLGILSNWDYRLLSLLGSLGLTDFFQVVLVSALEGFQKPDPGYFRLATARAGVPPDTILHVGDQKKLDLLPARQAGWHGLLVNRKTETQTKDIINTLQSLLTIVPEL